MLGSSQTIDPSSAEICALRNVEVARRPAGGGAVHLAPWEQVWIDFWLPRDDPLWDDDIIRSAQWAGEAWARALGALGVEHLAVHRGRSTQTRWSRFVCFSGTGPGEVTASGSKVMGMAQRRTREGARFFTVAPVTWEPSTLLGLLRSDLEDYESAALDLRSAAVGLRDLLPAAARPSGRTWPVNSAEPAADASVESVELVELVERAVLEALP